jgi:WD40 repeat protein
MLSRFKVPDTAHSTASNSDGSRIAPTGLASSPPGLWDAFTGQRLADIKGHAKRVFNIATSADGETLATASYDGTIRFFDAEDARPVGAIDVDLSARISAVAFHPAGALVAASNENGKVFFFERASGKLLRTLDAHTTWIQDLEFSPDGERLLTCGRQDHTARVWHAQSGALELTLAAHRDNIARGAWSPDGRVIATSGMDQAANIWDARTGELLRTIQGPSYTAVFSPDGSELLTTGYNGYAVLWETALDPRTPEELSAFVRARSPWALASGRLVLRE